MQLIYPIGFDYAKKVDKLKFMVHKRSIKKRSSIRILFFLFEIRNSKNERIVNTKIYAKNSIIQVIYTIYDITKSIFFIIKNYQPIVHFIIEQPTYNNFSNVLSINLKHCTKLKFLVPYCNPFKIYIVF